MFHFRSQLLDSTLFPDRESSSTQLSTPQWTPVPEASHESWVPRHSRLQFGPFQASCNIGSENGQSPVNRHPPHGSGDAREELIPFPNLLGTLERCRMACDPTVRLCI